MPDLSHDLTYPNDFWVKNPNDLKSSELDEAFKVAWRSQVTSDQRAIRFQMLVSEMNSRSSKRYFWASTLIAFVALVVALYK